MGTSHPHIENVTQQMIIEKSSEEFIGSKS